MGRLPFWSLLVVFKEVAEDEKAHRTTTRHSGLFDNTSSMYNIQLDHKHVKTSYLSAALFVDIM
jgi:hypothetical protein